MLLCSTPLFGSFEAKRLELEKWLARMEQRAERMGTVATTADILEAQQKEQKVSPLGSSGSSALN